jgi:dynein heavy chain
MKKDWYSDPWRGPDIDAVQICATVKELSGELTKMKMKYKDGDEVLESVAAEIGVVAKHTNLIAALGNKSLLDNHWALIWQLTDGGQPSGTLQSFNLNLLLSANIDQHFDEVEAISARATGEAGIREAIRKIAEEWDHLAFVVKNYRDTKNRFFITEIDELVQQLEDNQMTVGTSMGSRYVNAIKEEVL